MSLFYINLDVESTGERYDIRKFMPFTDNFDPLTSEFMRKLPDVESAGIYRVDKFPGRPDQISYEIYQTFQYWWVIMAHNKIIRIDDIKIGDEISFPNINDVEDLFFSLKSKQVALENN